jgi:hypothetical protein
MKNTAIDILGYKERKKDNKERFDEEWRHLMEQNHKAYQTHLARSTTESKKNMRRKGNGCT